MNNFVEKTIAANQMIKAVEGGVLETPLEISGVFSERTGADFLLKGEHLQRTGSFKLRGAMTKVLNMSEKERARGIITASSGNHGAATSLVAKLTGVEATVYLPEDVSDGKIIDGGQEVEIIPSAKMSKSKKNVVDPANIIAQYGADAARWFVLSNSPPERDVEWTAAGADAAWKHLQRVWRMADEINQSTEAGSPDPKEVLALQKATHRAVDVVTGGIEPFFFGIIS